LRARGIQPADDAALKKAIADITPTILVETIDEMLLVQRGKELGYKMTDEDFNRVVTRIRTDNKLDTDEVFHAALKQEGMTIVDLRASLERQMLVTRVQQAEVMGKITVGEEEARAYHAAHVQEFTRPGQVTVREIQIAVTKSDKGINVGLDDEAKASALNPAELTPAFQELLRSLKPGDVSEVIRTPAGYQIIKLESQTPDTVLTPEEARDRIGDAIFEEKRQVELKKYLEKQRAQAIIEWKNDEIKKAWQSKIGVPTPEPSVAVPEKPATH
jgi:peptidyl-prolyl cis-trans isomerase SurA